MSEFDSAFWPWAIGIATVVSLALCAAFLFWASRGSLPTVEASQDQVWDEDLRENNNPLPGWWRWLFYGSIAFAAVYLVLFPGLAVFPGTRAWTQETRYAGEVAEATALYAPIYQRFATMSVSELSRDVDARRIGERLFLNNCTACHSSDARGGIGYPSLRDADWQWEATPEAIETTITSGRQGVMQAWAPQLGDEAVENLTQYVLTLSGRSGKAAEAQAGKELFEAFCFSCHRLSGQGNPLVGAPNLTDDVWRWGGSEASIRSTIAHGRIGVMPAHGETLGGERVRLLAAYVYGLGGGR